MKRTYNVSEAAKAIGVSVKTLQRWDREGKLVANRTPSNRRYYTDKQIKDICIDNNDLEENHMSLSEYLKKMKIGDVISIEFEDECVDYITKTKWFEMTIFVLGGTGRNGKPVIIDAFYEEDEIDSDIIENKIKELTKEKFNVKLKRNKGELTIIYKADEVFRNFEDENFCYRM